jgi:DNA mismatch repair ATPase MutL
LSIVARDAVRMFSPASHPKGTTAFVDGLFYNAPARRAFLKRAPARSGPPWWR